MEIPNIYSPLLDPIIKYILSFEQGSAPLLSLLNAFQIRAGYPLMEEVFPWTTGIEKESLEDKLTVSDVAARDTLGRIHQIEIQTANHPFLRERNIYSWARRYGRQLKGGELYSELKPVIHILVTGFPVFPNLSEIHHECQITLRNHPDEIFSRHFEFHVLEITPQKAEQFTFGNDLLSRWSQFLYYANQKEEEQMREITQEDSGLQAALDRYKTYCTDPNLKYLAEISVNKMTDVMTAIDSAARQGKAEGKADSLISVLTRKFGKVPQGDFVRIYQIRDEIVLESLLFSAMDSTTLEEFESNLP